MCFDEVFMNIPIFLSADNNFAPFVATTIASICDHTQSFCDFYVLDGGITEDNKANICELKKQFNNFSIEFLPIDFDKELSSIDYQNIGNWISISTYSRFLIPLLKPNIDKALYSDVDVIVMGDIAEMYRENLDGYALGGVAEALGQAENIKRLNLSEKHKYFSAGNLLIDCKKWREQNITQQLCQIEEKYRKVLKFADMDVLNIFFDHNYKILPPKYCFINQNYFFDDVEKDVLIRHYNGAIKPWHISFENDTVRDVPIFWHYAKMTPFYNELWDKCQKQDQTALRRQLRVYKMMNQAQAKIRMV